MSYLKPLILAIVAGILGIGIVHAQSSSVTQSLHLTIAQVAIMQVCQTEIPENETLTTSEDSNLVQLKTSSWINYSSIVGIGSENRITVCSPANNLPENSKIILKAGETGNPGVGEYGTVCTDIVLSTYPQEIIREIGSCYTGIGEGYGPRINYYWLHEGGPVPKQELADLDLKLVFTIMPAL